jgi:hypothetical protein
MNNKVNASKIWAIGIIAFSLLGGCDDDPALPDNLVTFETAALGFEGEETEIKVELTREASKDTGIGITITSDELVYGTDFTTDPDGSSGTITVTVPQGSLETTFRVIRTAGIFLNGDESITFTIASSAEPVLPGAAEDITTELSFTAITSEGSQLQLSGKTDASPYANSVYADLSANKQIPVDRKSWNLGFYNGEAFRVILNPGYQSTAVALAKTDISTVTLADADAVMNLNHDPSDPATLPLADYWDGDLTKTTFSEVAASENDNKVYLVSFEGSKNKDQWFKVKVTRNAQGYKIQYARIGETTIKTLEVPKNATHNFNFVSLESNAIVVAEPPKGNWDIEWSYSTNNSGLNTPYWFQDFVLLNHVGGAGAVEIVSASAAAAETAYSSFVEADLAGLTFISKRDVIGSKWRATGGPGGGATGIRRDRFYVIKDPRGNIYKLKFVSMGLGSDGGERGKPVIEYKLVKKAD